MSVESPPSTDPLLALFSGKRRWARVPACRDVRVVATGGAFRGHTLDVSGGGALIQITDPAFYRDDRDAFGLVEGLTPTGEVEVSFLRDAVQAPAEVVRITVGRDGHVGLGARFERALDESDRVRLAALPVEVSRDPLVDEAHHPLKPARRGPYLMIYTAPVAGGPRYVAPVLGIGQRTISARIPYETASARDLCADVYGHPLVGVIRDGQGRHHLGRSCLLAVGPTRGGVEVRIRTAERIPGRVRKSL